MNRTEKAIEQLKANISGYFGDIQVLRKAFEFGCVEPDFLMQEIITTGWIYDYPAYWLTKKNIDSCLDYAARINNTELVAYLLDYKNKNFPLMGEDAFDLTINN